MVVGGALTALPLIGFADAVRRIPYSVVGLLQYIAPTLQLLCGVLLLGEDFGSERAIGFVLIWISLAIYAGDGLLRARRRPLPAASERPLGAKPANLPGLPSPPRGDRKHGGEGKRGS